MNNQSLIAAIESLGADIQSKKDTIFFQELQIKELKETVGRLEKELDEMKGV